MPGAKVPVNLANSIRFAICVKERAACLLHSLPEDVPGVRAQALMGKGIAAKIVMVQAGHMFIGPGFLVKLDR